MNIVNWSSHEKRDEFWKLDSAGMIDISGEPFDCSRNYLWKVLLLNLQESQEETP